MSSIDERIVGMKFNNGQFEKGVQSTLNSLSALKKGLNLDNAKKSLSGLADAGKNFSLRGMDSGIDGLSGKFIALSTIGITALSNITNKAINAGSELVKSLTIDPIKAGFDEYELKMTSIQTILSNTSRYGTKLKDVTANLDELNAYADKTIYNFGDMTRNIGLFTNAGIKIEDATSMIKGFSNEAAASGTSSQGAAGAAYQLSQALSAGTIRLMDWKSLTNVGMGNKNMQNGLIELADAMGEFKGKSIDAEGAAKNFNASLEKEWLSAEVMQNYLQIQAGDLSKKQMKNLGLTEKQIKAFNNQAKIAEDAATKVRTVTGLIGTLQEGVGSAWSETFDLLIGDFDQATELWTNVNNALGPIIGAAGKARNAMLQDWVDLGGRDLGLKAIGNLFTGLMGIIKPIQEAFREIFPPTTGKQLFAITAGIEKFTSAFKMGGAVANAFKSVFKGVFGILDIGIEIVKGIARYFLDFFAIVGESTGGLVLIAGAIGDVLTKIHQWATEGEGIKRFFDAVIAGRREAMDPLIDFITRLGGAFATLISGDFQGFVEQFKASFGAFDPLVEKVRGAVEKLGVGFTNAKNLVKSFFADSSAEAQRLYTGALTPLLGYIDKLKQAFADLKARMGIKASDVGGDMTSGMESGLKSVESVGDRVKNLWQKIADGFKSVVGFLRPAVDGIVNVFTTVRDKIADFLAGLSFEDAVSLLNTGILIGLYMGIKKFVDNLNGLTVDIGKVVESIVEVFGQLTDTLKAMQQNLQAGTLLKIAGAVALLAAATVALSLIDAAALGKALGAMAVLFGGLMATLQVFSKITAAGTAGMASAAGSLVLLAVAVNILASAVTKLSKLDWNGIAKGLVGVGGLLAALALFTKFASVDKEATLRTGGLILLAVAINLLAIAVGKMGSLDIATLGKGLGAVAAVMAFMAGITKVMTDTKGVFQAAAGMLILSGAMLAMSLAVRSFAGIPLGDLGYGLGAMAGALAAVAGAMHLMPKNMVVSAKALVLVSASLVILAGVMKVMGGMSIEDTVQSLVLLAGALNIISITMSNMINALPGAAALLVVTGALTMLAPVLLLLGTMDIASIGIALGVLAGVFIIFGIAGYALGPVVPVLMGLGQAMMLIAGAAALAGLAMVAFGAGFAALAASGAAGTAVLVGIVVSLGALIPTIMEQVGMGIRAIAKVIAESGPVFTSAMVTLILSLTKAIRKTAPDVIDTLVELVHKLLDVLVENVPQFVDKGLKLVTGLLNGIAKNIGGVINAGVNIIVAFLDGIGQAIPRIMQAAVDLVIDFIDGLTSAITNNQERVNTSMRNLAEAMIDAMTSAIANIGSIGMDIVRGIANGIRENVSNAVNAAREMAKAAWDAVTGFLGIRSPSRKFKEIGKFTVQGFVLGLKGSDDEVQAAFANMKGGLKEVMNDSKGDIKELEEKLKKLTSARKQDAKAIEKTKNALAQARSENKKATSAYKHLTEKLREEKDALKSLARELERVQGSLEQRKQELADAVKTRDDYAKSLKDQYSDLGEITKETKLGDYVKDLKTQIDETRKFAGKLQELRKMGLNDKLYEELLTKGTTALPFVEELVKGGVKSVNELNSLSNQLDSAAGSLGNTASKELYQAGVDVAKGLVEGLKNEEKRIDAEMDRIANRMASQIKKKLGIKSPSREFMKVGGFTAAGLIKGLEQSTPGVQRSAGKLGTDALSSMKKALVDAGSVLSTEVDMTPTIRPVLDLSAIKKDAGLINGMLPAANMKVDASYRKAARISANENVRDAAVAPSAPVTPVTKQVTFNQYNNSPKALSDADIYRQTKNQLSQVKGGLPI